MAVWSADVDGTGIWIFEMKSQFTLGILAPNVELLHNSIKGSDKIIRCPKLGSIVLLLNTKKSPTACPSNSANQTLAKYGLSFPNRISLIVKFTP